MMTMGIIDSGNGIYSFWGILGKTATAAKSHGEEAMLSKQSTREKQGDQILSQTCVKCRAENISKWVL
jgi:hypothetical protein